LPLLYSRPSWSADGALIAFAGVAGERLEEPSAILIAGADGSGLRRVAGTSGGFDPILSPDGDTVAFARTQARRRYRPGRGRVTVLRSTSVWLSDLTGGPARRLTPWRNRLSQTPSSFFPDGSTLAITRKLKGRITAVALRLDGSGTAVIARGAGEAVYSPDGNRVALITVGRRRGNGELTFTPTELAIANADGSGLTRLTATRGKLELEPSWDPSGRRLAYTQLNAPGGEYDLLGFGDSIMEINVDGTCRTKVLSDPDLSLYGATWQPGHGRAAGPISC
jgi:Tol biopolymer transport system component